MVEKQPKRKKNKLLSHSITLICIAVFGYSLYSLGGIALDYYHNHQVLKDVQEVYDNFEPDANTNTVNNGQIRPQFEELHKINKDIVGWIAIDDTKINYPILQAEDNDYYLYRNYKSEDSRAGSIFMDYRNDVGFGNLNMILYGHDMKDGSMFRHLNKFLEKDFFDHHPEIYVDTLYGSYDAEVFAVYYTTTEFDYIQTDFQTLDEYGELLNEIKEKSIFETDVQMSETDQMITLSTCDYTLDSDEGRLVVHAKLKEKD